MKAPVTIAKQGWTSPVATGYVTKIQKNRKVDDTDYELVVLRNVQLSKGSIMFLLQGGNLSSLFDGCKVIGLKDYSDTLLVFSSFVSLVEMPVVIEHIVLSVGAPASETLRNKIFVKEFIST